eukprot:gb/GFBE01064711.1/.p1 GENE.gb/GFBE01064711.1/~~gb/GFBE01064711.1/.p1  ORF type:complete len:104 (+),score=21.19 gb/GFBE01064711.1/:1-312(+)
MLRSTSMFYAFVVIAARLVLCIPVAHGVKAGGSSEPESLTAFEKLQQPVDYMEGPVWQDLKLLLSFAMGVIFVRAAEVLFDSRANSAANSERSKKLELYALLT